MARAACLVLVVALGTTPDVAQLFRFSFQQGQTADPEKTTPQGNLPQPATDPGAKQQPSATSGSSDSSSSSHSDHLTDAMRIAIIRAISGEFVRAQVPLPGGKQGLHISGSKPYLPATDPSAAKAAPDANDSPHVMIIQRAPVIHEGDHVQITNVAFHEKSIVLEINGGGSQKWHLRDHLQVGMGAGYPSGNAQQSSSNEGQGATLYVDFGHRLPDISPDDLKLRLAPILDFNNSRSANVQYADSLPPEFQQAIKDRIAAVGMDREMVLAAMGRPDKKVRERDADGNDTEDWIYGNPPAKTIFVTFIGDKVSRVREFH